MKYRYCLRRFAVHAVKLGTVVQNVYCIVKTLAKFTALKIIFYLEESINFRNFHTYFQIWLKFGRKTSAHIAVEDMNTVNIGVGKAVLLLRA
jgi:hypothetical protein